MIDLIHNIDTDRPIGNHQQIIKKALAAVRPVFRLDINDGIHGISHWSRVWHHGKFLSAQLDINPDVLTWFAYLHDSRRFNDGYDPKHGSRAADFAMSLRREGVVNELSDREFEWVCEAMRLHSDGHTEADIAICACWDSDRLDLGRVGFVPDPKKLCTMPARHTRVIDEAMRMSAHHAEQEGRKSGCNLAVNRIGRTRQ